MDFFLHELGICAYMDKEPQGKAAIDGLRRWISWHRRRGVDFFYLYTSFDTATLKTALAWEISGRLVLLLQAKSGGEKVRLSLYKDCLRRSRYVCEHLVFMEVGDYLAPDGQKSLAEIIGRQFDSSCAALYLPTDRGPLCIASPLLVRGFHSEGVLDAYGPWDVRKAAGMVLSHSIPTRSIALLSHVMARNGAPMALLTVARILRKAGYEVDVFSLSSGDLEEDFEAEGIRVIIDPALQATSLADLTWYKDYDLIFVNTAVMARCLVKPLDGAPVIWWLHESPSSYKWCGLTAERLALLSAGKVTTLCVSQFAREAFLALRPDWPMAGTLTLGMKDAFPGARRKKSAGEPFVFLMVGTIQKNKGQDIFLRAIALLPPQEREKCEFWLLGEAGQSTEAGYMERVKALAAEHKEVRFLGALPHEKVWEIYGQVDAVVVPSWEETLSMVAMEAMMMSLPCIMSDSVGMAGFIEEGESALTYPVGEAAGLSEKMQYLLSHPQAAERIGQSGRNLYEQNFTDVKFAEKLMECVAAAR